MSQIKKSVTELVGNTPILEISRYAAHAEVTDATILAKLEYLNPAGSVKDRIALAMIEDAEKKGILKPGATIIEPTSGNTGIGLAAIATAKGYRAILTLPDTMSVERRNLLAAYGAELVLTEGAKGMKGAIAKADELKESIEGAVILGQFVNPANPEAHRNTTGPEIWEQTDGKVDIFVAGVGTGGTVTGVGEYLKSKNPDIKVVAVEPATSPVLSTGNAGPHKIQGIGAGFVPDTLNTSVYDEVITIENDDAFAVCLLRQRTIVVHRHDVCSLIRHEHKDIVHRVFHILRILLLGKFVDMLPDRVEVSPYGSLPFLIIICSKSRNYRQLGVL